MPDKIKIRDFEFIREGLPAGREILIDNNHFAVIAAIEKLIEEINIMRSKNG